MLLATAVAGAGVFLVAFLGLGLVSSLVRWGERRRRAGSPRGAGDRALGAFFGSVRGVSLALLVGVLGYWLQAFNTLDGRPAAPAVVDSAVASMSQVVVESAAGALMDTDSTGGRLAVRAMAHPALTFTAVQALLEDPRLLMLRDDGPFWAAVEAGEVEAATQRVSFTTVAYSQELRTRFADSGFISKADAEHPEAFRTAVSGALVEAGPRIRSLREDPELQRLAEDPEVIALLREGNTLPRDAPACTSAWPARSSRWRPAGPSGRSPVGSWKARSSPSPWMTGPLRIPTRPSSSRRVWRIRTR
jgi:hypothetical protein